MDFYKFSKFLFEIADTIKVQLNKTTIITWSIIYIYIFKMIIIYKILLAVEFNAHPPEYTRLFENFFFTILK